LQGRGTVAYQWTGDGPETVVVVNGSVFNYHQWNRQALPILHRGLGGRCRFLQYDYVGDVAQEAAAFAEGLPQVRGVPILLLNGTADTTTPVQVSRELAELLPEAELVEFEGVTHMGPMMLKKEAQPVFERYVAFMESVLSG